MHIGLYFGTFNPIHVGHLIIANYMANYSELDKVWLVVTPQNPLKSKASILEDYHRLAMVRVGIEDNPMLKASDIEFNLPKPSYTIDTLAYLKERYPEDQFSLIMGEDNLRSFHKWKNYPEILSSHTIFVYPRVLTEKEENDNDWNLEVTEKLRRSESVVFCDAPIMKLSASFIREAIRNKKDVRYMLTEPVYNYLTEMHFYKK